METEKETLFIDKKNQTEKLESTLESIMTAEEYSRIKHETPYTFKLQEGEKELHYFGSLHVQDPKDPLFEKIETAFSEASPDIVLAEGVYFDEKKAFEEQIKSLSRDEIINQMGESGFALKLALEKGIEWHSPEPPNEHLFKYLEKRRFSREQIFAWGTLLTLSDYNRQKERRGFKQYVQPCIEAFRNATNWEGFDYSYEHAMQICEQILGKALDVENEPNAEDFTDPIPWETMKGKQTVLNRIGTAASLLRDRTMISDIAELLETHKRIFIVYGTGHAVMQKPALEKLMEQR